MITIPQPIKYEKDLHFHDIITKPLEPKLDLIFIQRVLIDLKRDKAKAYIVIKDNGKIMICREGLRPAIIERHNFFALQNKNGDIVMSGKNLRRPESMLAILKNIFKKSPAKLYLLKRERELSVAGRCQLVGYTLLKQDTPFE